MGGRRLIRVRCLTQYVKESTINFMEVIMAETVFGKRLVALRKAAGLSQPELAEKAGVSLGGLRGLEQGRRMPRWDIAIALARALSVSLDAFTDKPKRGK
jgi:DNA-binding XRE family transcriptional regulator